MIQKAVFLLCLLTSIWSCTNHSKKVKILAEVGSKKLYLTEVENLLNEDQSRADSINIIADFTQRWINNELILKQAEKNLSEKDLDVNQDLESYRASLLIYRYEQAYINQRMDTLVTQDLIKEFYESKKDNFQLSSLLIKGFFIKLPVSSKITDKVRALYRLNREKDFTDLERLCVQDGISINAFEGQWVDFANIAKELPLNAGSYENKIIKFKYLEEHDEQYNYFIQVKEVLMKGGVAPLEHVQNDIRTIILNKRRQDLINQLEEKIIKEAESNKEYRINIDQ